MKRKREGFTLVEAILVLALLGLVTTVSYSIFFAGEKSFEIGAEKANEQADYRILREYLVNELRYIDYLDNHPNPRTSYNKYYSLEINKNGKLIKTKYERDNPGLGVKTIFPININNLDLKLEIRDKGIINVDIINDNITSEYSFTIALENEITDDEGILTNDSTIIYYTYPEDNIQELAIEEGEAGEEIERHDNYVIGKVLGRIYSYEGDGGSLVIPSKIGKINVKRIAVDSFKNKKLTSVVIPEGVTRIEDRAFMKNDLKSVVIPNSVKYIDSWVFSYNPNLIKITIGNDVRFWTDDTDRQFGPFYTKNGKKGGTYIYNGTTSKNGKWIKQ